MGEEKWRGKGRKKIWGRKRGVPKALKRSGETLRILGG